jgi:hypothetical protein
MVSRDQIAAAIWEATLAPRWSARQPSPAERRRALRQADAVLALPSVTRLLAVEAAARPCVAEITTYEEREALRRALSQ